MVLSVLWHFYKAVLHNLSSDVRREFQGHAAAVLLFDTIFIRSYSHNTTCSEVCCDHGPVSRFLMTRFAAYSSGSSTDEEEEISRESVSQKRRSQAPPDDVDDDDDSSGSDEGETTSSSDSEPSEMLEGELINSPPRRPGRTKPKDRNALVEDENGEIQYAHEMDKRASPGSTSSRSSPGAKSNPGYHGDPTVIPWAQLVGVDAQKMHVMQASLFRTQDEAAALRVLNQPPKGKGSATRLEVNMKATTGRKHRRDSGGDALRYDSREVCMFNDSLLLVDSALL